MAPINTPPLSSNLTVSPGAVSLQPGMTTSFSVQDRSVDVSTCTWTSSDTNVLTPSSGSTFTAVAEGAATVLASCGDTSGVASVSVTSINSTKGYTITAGGTYSGNFRSDDPNVPAVTINTNQPVILQNSTIFSRGDLIHIMGVGLSTALGSKVTVRNVTGIALDPGTAGLYRGAFIRNEEAASISVTNTTMTGVSFGIYLAPSTVSSITIDNNLAYNIEDRPSDGHGGLVASRAMKGHFIQFNNVVAPKGAEIAWNQVIDTPGQASVEDVIDMFDSYGGSLAAAINIHDNYLQGIFSTGSTVYTGDGITMEGDSPLLAKTTGFVRVANNQIVMTANAGMAIAYGHDIAMVDNRIVSCGIDASGKRYGGPSGNAVDLWNATGSSVFFNNSVTGTTGGLVRPTATGQPMISDLWQPGASSANNDTAEGNDFDDPCWTGGQVLSNSAELTERVNWDHKLQQAGQVLGDTHVGSQSSMHE